MIVPSKTSFGFSRRTALFGLSALALTPTLALATPNKRVFRLNRDGADIGRHSLEVQKNGDDLNVVVDIQIAVKVLGITAYRYEHLNREVWRDSMLISIDSKTNDDGDDDFCRARRTENGFAIEGSGYSGDAPANSAPTSYWNYQNLQSPVWIDTQIGRLLNVSYETTATANGGERWIARDLSERFETALFYDAEKEWRGAEFDGRGETVSYEEIQPGPALLALL